MSLLRRVKTFSVKKYKSNDEINEPKLTPRVRRRNLAREKSFSMENVPLRIDIETNDLFKRQKQKIEKSDCVVVSAEKKPVPLPRKISKRRKSVSFDDVRFSKCVEELKEHPVQLRRGRERLSRYKTVDVINDLIKDFENEPKDTVDHSNRPAHFPVDEEEEVQIRDRKRTGGGVVRPQTYSTTLTKKKEDPLDFKGVCRLEINEDRCVKIRQKETLRYQNGYLQILDERGSTKATIANNLRLKKGAKLFGKKEVEMRDINERIFRFHFDSSKDAKLFIEIEKAYSTVPSSSPYKNLGPWFQLKKLLKKRSSRDILESKGILKNEPIFGNTLEELCSEENPVPEVVTRIVEMIEEKGNIVSLGVYRASANLAVVQNIRCQIDYGKWNILEHYRNDVDVLAGTLKLFFRELKYPLIPYDTYQKLNDLFKNKSEANTDDIPKILHKLPKSHRNTLLYIIKHLLNVCKYKEQNKMDFHNIAIVWGPSLMTYTENCTDLVAQTTEFTRITEEILIFYSNQNENFDVIEDTEETDSVYELVRTLTEVIEERIETEGIYRKSGSNTKIDKIIKAIEKQNLDEIDFRKCDIHDLCCVLKKYVTLNREAVAPDHFFYDYLQICDKYEFNDTKIRDEVSRLISELPRKNIVYLLFRHLNKVVSNEAKNKMSFGILTDIWMTTLMANVSAETYKRKMSKYSKLFLILMNLNNDLPDLVTEPRNRHWSKYDNVPDDIHNDAETSTGDKIRTKL